MKVSPQKFTNTYTDCLASLEMVSSLKTTSKARNNINVIQLSRDYDIPKRYRGCSLYMYIPQHCLASV